MLDNESSSSESPIYKTRAADKATEKKKRDREAQAEAQAEAQRLAEQAVQDFEAAIAEPPYTPVTGELSLPTLSPAAQISPTAFRTPQKKPKAQKEITFPEETAPVNPATPMQNATAASPAPSSWTSYAVTPTTISKFLSYESLARPPERHNVDSPLPSLSNTPSQFHSPVVQEQNAYIAANEGLINFIQQNLLLPKRFDINQMRALVEDAKTSVEDALPKADRRLTGIYLDFIEKTGTILGVINARLAEQKPLTQDDMSSFLTTLTTPRQAVKAGLF
jgi:hypothetical protein